MLTVRTVVKESDLGGLGLFASEKISKGTPVWIFNPKFDIFFEQSEVESLPDLQKNLVKRYAYLSSETGKYVYCIDDSRFMNHSAKNYNVDTVKVAGELETRDVANRDIEAGEEILVNYRTFDAADAESDEEYLNK